MSRGLFVDSFHVSVQEAVKETLDSHKPLLVYLYRQDQQSEAFNKRYFENEHEAAEDDTAESTTGEQSTLAFISTYFVKLRLLHGSIEFGYFEALFPNLIVPSIYIVKAGQLADVISGDLSMTQFVSRIHAAAISHNPQQQQRNEEVSVSSSNLNDLLGADPSSGDSHQALALSLRSINMSSTRTPNFKPHPSTLTNANDDERDKAVQRHKREVSEMKKKKANEKKRLRLLLELDRKEIELRDQANADTATLQRSLQREITRMTNASDSCTLSIKFFDGSSSRHEFKSEQTLQDVRHWLDTDSGVEIIPSSELLPSFASSSHFQPVSYVFHLPEIPRITYSCEDEEKSLQDLGLSPRSALILKPIYDESGSADICPSGITRRGAIYSKISSILASVGGAFYSFFDYGALEQHVHLSSSESEDEDDDDDSQDDHADVRISSAGTSDMVAPGMPLLTRTPSILLIEPHRSAGQAHTNFDGNISRDNLGQSRPGTPNSIARSQGTNRVLGYSDVAKDRPDDDTIESYNGNAVNLDKKKRKTKKSKKYGNERRDDDSI